MRPQPSVKETKSQKNIFQFKDNSPTYDHRFKRTGHPVRSAVLKLEIGGLVVGSVTTSEYPLLYVFDFIFAEHFTSSTSLLSIIIPCAPRPSSSASSLQQVGKDSALGGWNGISPFTIGPLYHPVLMAIGGWRINYFRYWPGNRSYEGIQTISLSGPAVPRITA